MSAQTSYALKAMTSATHKRLLNVIIYLYIHYITCFFSFIIVAKVIFPCHRLHVSAIDRAMKNSKKRALSSCTKQARGAGGVHHQRDASLSRSRPRAAKPRLGPRRDGERSSASLPATRRCCVVINYLTLRLGSDSWG